MISKLSYVPVTLELCQVAGASPTNLDNRTQKFSNLQRLGPIDPESRYVQFIAIGNLEVDGFNMNYDGFPYEHFEDERPGFGWRSFAGKRAHVEHNSSAGIQGSIGELVDSHLNSFIIPPKFGGRKYSELDSFASPERQEVLTSEGQLDGTIEVLMRIDSGLLKTADLDDKQRNTIQHVMRMIDSGQRVFCSMGMNLSYSVCSACGNLAYVEPDYCSCLGGKNQGFSRRGSVVLVPANTYRDLLDAKRIRPEWLPHIVRRASDVHEILSGISNKVVAAIVGEINHEHSFFELSVVANPAFVRAEALSVIASEQVTVDWEALSNQELQDLYRTKFSLPAS